MPIDPNIETLICLAEAARSLAARGGGKNRHVSCIYGWTRTGCRGVILESLQCGGAATWPDGLRHPPCGDWNRH